MAEASIALAERDASKLKSSTAKLGGPAPTSRQLLMLRVMSVIAPPSSAPMWRRIMGPILLILALIAVICLGFGIVTLVTWGKAGSYAWLYGFILVLVVFGVLYFFGRRRQAAARARAAEQRAAAFGGKR
jgi:hypothetical protein